MIDLTRMFSESPGMPGRRQQIPRTTSSIEHAGLRSLIQGVDDFGIDQRVHLQPDRGGFAVAGEGGLGLNVLEHSLAQGQRRHRHLLDVARFRIAGDVVEHPRGIPSDDRIGGEVGEIGIDARGHGMVVPGSGMDVGRQAAALAAHDQRQLGVGLQFNEIRTRPERRRARDRAPSGCWLPHRTAP